MTAACVETDLGVAVLTKNEAAAKSLIAKGADVNRSDTIGCPPLHYAAFIGDTALVVLLLDNGADINAQDSHGLTALHRAIAALRCDVAEILIERGCDTTIRGKMYQTPLHICAIHNVPSVAALLLRSRYPSLDHGDSQGCTALHHAAYHGHVEVAEHLLKAGINMAAMDKLGRTAMHSMACGGSTGMLSVLREAGASITVREYHGRTVAHYAAMASQTELLAALLKIDKNFVNDRDDDGYTPLHYAVQNGQNAKTIELLVQNGCDVTAAASDGATPLHVAASLAESAKPIEYLINCKGINLNAKNSDGMTPLHLASEWTKVSRVDTLIQAGAEVDARSHDSATPLHCAAIGGHQLVVKHLLKFGADVNARMRGELTPLHLAAYNSSRPVVQTLVEMGADIEAKDCSKRTPLFLAAGSIADNGSYTVEYLVRNKAVVNLADKLGHTPLHMAASKGLEQVVDILLEAGAEVDIPDMRGRNALHLAVLTHSESTVKKLCCADERAVYRQDINGFYPLHYAAYIGAEQMCLDLFECMKDMNEMPTSGLYRAITPFHLAATNNKAKPLLRLARDVKKRTDKVMKKQVLHDRPLFAYTDVKNRIPLHYAMKYGHLDPTSVLLGQQGADLCLTWRDKDEMTPLHFAAANGKNACIDWVLRKFPKISVNRKDAKGRSCGMLSLTSLSGPFLPLIRKSNLERCDTMGRGYLHRAVYSRDEDLLLKVLEKCHPNSRDVNGVTPLHVAAAVGDHRAAVILLEHGADRLVRDNRGFTPIDWAAAYNNMMVLQELTHISARQSPDSALGSGCSTSNNNSGDAITDDSRATANSNSTDEVPKYGCAGLLFASYLGHLTSVMNLVERDSKLISTRDPRGRSALHLAAWRGHYQCVEYLIEKGIDIEAVDDSGATALMYAVRDPVSVHIVEFLLNHGADIAKRDYHNNTVLHHSCLSKNEEAGKVLTVHLAKNDPDRELCNAVNDCGETALHIALRNGLIEFMLTFVPFGSKSMWIKDNNGRFPVMSVVDDQDVLDCMQLLLSCMLEASPADVSMLLLNDRRQSQQSLAEKKSVASEEPEFY